MYTKKDLKDEIVITEQKVPCPVKDCDILVDRKRKTNNENKEFVCRKHRIIITPSTFIYQDIKDILVFQDDIKLLNEILGTKRESRLANENSEDAVSWNVFRYLETEGQLLKWLNEITKETHSMFEIMYWSYCNKKKGTYPLLEKARDEFGERANQGSEPDIIIKTDKTLFFIEAKLFSSNKTSGTGKTINNRKENNKQYETGGNSLFKNIFASSYVEIINDQKYELMRFWLLGYWMARQEGLNFQLINLVLERNEKEIEKGFGKHINQNNTSIFSRQTWESLYHFINENGNKNQYHENIVSYFENKTAGYTSDGKLRDSAFDLS